MFDVFYFLCLFNFIIFFFFFFSSRRRHTRYIGDWSSDVCSSDLSSRSVAQWRCAAGRAASPANCIRSEERRVGKSVDLGGRRIIKKKKKKKKKDTKKEKKLTNMSSM